LTECLITDLSNKIQEDLRNKIISTDENFKIDSITIIAYKNQKLVELWFHQTEKKYPIKIKEYPFTAFSGDIGPKLKSGDMQIPEGVYGIEYLNPNSLFYLSMKMSYPNEIDKIIGKKMRISDMGDDIFIHGKNSSAGCIPIGDKAIEELFYCVGKIGASKVKIIISPYELKNLLSNNSEILNNKVFSKKYKRIENELKKYN
jgi:murein L,D-transpeptidase YafK